MQLPKPIVTCTPSGASGEVVGIFGAGSDVKVEHRRCLRACGEERIPVAAMDARQAEVRRDLAERDRPHATRGIAPDLVGGERRVPQRHEAERDQSPTAGAAPLFDHPVVVGLHAQQREVTVFRLQERLAAEPWKIGKAQRRFGPIAIHVDEPLGHVVATGSHVLEGGTGHRHVVAGSTGGGDRSFERLREILVHPVVHQGTVGAGPLDVTRALES